MTDSTRSNHSAHPRNRTIPRKSWTREFASVVASLAIPTLRLCGRMRAEEPATGPENESATAACARVGAFYQPWFKERGHSKLLTVEG